MLTDEQILVNMAIDHCDGEGDWCLPVECHVGEDDE